MTGLLQTAAAVGLETLNGGFPKYDNFIILANEFIKAMVRRRDVAALRPFTVLLCED